MPIHDWTRVSAGIFHHFHQRWISAISDFLNTSLLSSRLFALIEQTSQEQILTATHTITRKSNRVSVRHESGRVVAIVEIVSPGNKDSRNALRSFVEKAGNFLAEGIHLVIIDLFPPTPRDPQGIHKAIWDEIEDVPFELPPDKPLTLASYAAGVECCAYVEPVAVGDILPNMPLFLQPDGHIPLALEATYQTSWEVFPSALKPALEGSRG